MAKTRTRITTGLLLAGMFVFMACVTQSPPPSPPPLPPSVPKSPYVPITREIIDQINNESTSIIINSRNIPRPEELQYYISKEIVLTRNEPRQVLEINAKGELVQWEIIINEQLTLRQETPGQLLFYGGDNLMAMRICFDFDERLLLDFKQDAANGNRFYLVYDDKDNAKQVTYGVAEYSLSFSQTPPDSDAAGTIRDPRPYLEIIASSESETAPINRIIQGRRTEN
jgi:hypothetical protein